MQQVVPLLAEVSQRFALSRRISGITLLLGRSLPAEFLKPLFHVLSGKPGRDGEDDDCDEKNRNSRSRQEHGILTT